MILEELDETEAYRRIDAFLAEEAELFELIEVLGIHDEDVLKDFLKLGFTARTAPAIEMIPIAFVAWASGSVTDEECTAAVGAIYDSQLTEFPKTLSVVQTWLDIRPRRELWDLWVKYMHCRIKSRSMEQRSDLRQRLTTQARGVTRASGGWLGIGSICHAEQLVIDAIHDTFDGHHPIVSLEAFSSPQEA